jgi:hypothetical protein
MNMQNNEGSKRKTQLEERTKWDQNNITLNSQQIKCVEIQQA